MPSPAQLSEALADVDSEVIAFDFETQGQRPTDRSKRVVGVGVSQGRLALYIPVYDGRCWMGQRTYQWLLGWLAERRVVCHNSQFEDAWVYRDLGRYLNVEMDTLGMYKQLATEGWTGQTWSLKDAMLNVLNWDETNVGDLDEWLVRNGFASSQGTPDHGEMWRAPVDILGRYCALDADATWQLYQVFKPYLERFPGLKEYHQRDYLTECRLLVEQQFRGMVIDRPKLDAYGVKLEADIEGAKDSFLALPEVAPHIELKRQQAIATLDAAEPARYTKTGSQAKRWETWSRKLQAANEAPASSYFNLNSPQQKIWLFFDRMGYTPIKDTNGDAMTKADYLAGKVPSTDKKVLKTLGEPGKVVMLYNKLRDRLKFVSGCQRYVDDDSILRPQLKSCGTVTGRLSGGRDDE